MVSTALMLERYLRHDSPVAAVFLSVYLPAWWADRNAEGHSPESARTVP